MQAKTTLGRANYRMPLLAFLLSSAAVIGTAFPVQAATFNVTNATDLSIAIAAANINGIPNTIVVTGDIDLSLISSLPVIGDDALDDLTIDLGGFTISGGNATRIFFANAGRLRITNGALIDGLARGGDGGTLSGGSGGGGGGGGMVAGGALCVRS